jgi:hypothetical protein
MEQGKECVSRAEAAKQAAILFERIGVLHASYARAIVDELGEEAGRRLILKAIKAYGKHVGAQVREKAEASGLDNSPEHYAGDLPAYGTHERLEKVTVDGEERLRAYGRGWEKRSWVDCTATSTSPSTWVSTPVSSRSTRRPRSGETTTASWW